MSGITSHPGRIAVLFLAGALGCVEVPAPTGEGESFNATNADVHTRLASAALERGSLEPARASAREALRVDPGRVDAARILARADLLAGETRAAFYAAKRATTLAPEDAETWLLLADCAAALDDTQQRDRALARAAELGSTEARFVQAFESLANGDANACDVILADEHSTRAALGLVIEHLSATRRLEQALALVDAQLARQPNPELALTARRLRLALSRSNALASEAADPLVDGAEESSAGKRPSTEQILLVAATELRAGRPSSAADHYRGLLVSEPKSTEVRIALAEALLAAGDRTGALAAYRSALAIDPRDLAAIHGIARIEIEDSHFDAALDLLEGARSRHPTDAATVALIVVAAQRSGRHDRARIDAERVAELDPGGRFDLACRRLLERLAPPAAPTSSEHR